MIAGSHRLRVGQLKAGIMHGLGWMGGGHLEPGAT